MSSCGDSNDFIIPKGKEFAFTVQILEEDSFLPQNLDGFLNGSFIIIDTETGNTVPSVATVVLNKLTEEIVAPIALVQEQTELAIAVANMSSYYITINGTKYEKTYAAGDSPVDTLTIATDLFALLVNLPENVTASINGEYITINNTVGDTNILAVTTNIAKTGYVDGVNAVAGYVSTFYNDNGYLKGTIIASDTDKLEVSRGEKVDDYYLKSLYQGIIQVNFSDATINKTGIVCKIYVIHTGN